MALIKRQRTIFPRRLDLNTSNNSDAILHIPASDTLAESFHGSLQSADAEVNIPQKYPGRQRLPIKLPVKVSEQNTTMTPPNEHLNKENYIQVRLGTPWKTYQSLCSEKHGIQKDTICVKVRTTVDAPLNDRLCMIREQQKPQQQGLRFRVVDSPLLIQLLDVFLSDDSKLLFVYDYVDVSIQDVLAGPLKSLREYQIAHISRQIIKGLIWIHENLGLAHGLISLETILLSQTGVVKLGHIAEIQIQDVAAHKKEEDVDAFREVFLEMMKPAITRNKTLTGLSVETKYFIELVPETTLETFGKLLQTTFLTVIVREHCLARVAFLTARYKYRDDEVISAADDDIR